MAHANDLFNPVLFDHNVHRTDRRSAGAVDQRRAPDDQPVERPDPFVRVAIRSRRDGSGLRQTEQRRKQQQAGEQAFHGAS